MKYNMTVKISMQDISEEPCSLFLGKTVTKNNLPVYLNVHKYLK